MGFLWKSFCVVMFVYDIHLANPGEIENFHMKAQNSIKHLKGDLTNEPLRKLRSSWVSHQVFSGSVSWSPYFLDRYIGGICLSWEALEAAVQVLEIGWSFFPGCLAMGRTWKVFPGFPEVDCSRFSSLSILTPHNYTPENERLESPKIMGLGKGNSP